MIIIYKSKKIPFKHILIFALFIIAISFSIVFVYNNAFLYERPIATIIKTTIQNTEQTVDQYGNKDTLYTQHLVGEIQNGDKKGQHIYLINEYSDSGAYDEPYQNGNDVFVDIDKVKTENEEVTGSITGLKRDKYIAMIVWLFVIVLFLIGRRQGILTSVSLAVNVLLLSYALNLYVYGGANLIWICGILTLLFTVLSLLLVNGWNEKTFTAIIATLSGTLLSVGIAMLVMWMTSEEGLHYEEMQFLTRPYTLVFIAGLFIGSLGAVMDVAISISTAMFELYDTNKNITIQQLKKSGFDIGKDIMGTMTNILFFAYVSGSIPILIVYFSNHSPLGFALSINLSLELARALAGGIGIVMTIPIGLYVSIFFIKWKGARK